MITSLLLNGKLEELNSLRQTITHQCPQVQICGLASTLSEAIHQIEETKPHLIFIEKGNCDTTCRKVLQELSELKLETILISDKKDFAYDAIRFQIGAYLLKPLEKEDLTRAVKKISRQIQLKKEYREKQKMMNRMLTQYSKSELIGIPTIEGYEYIMVGDIIRCEGLQKCTRVITNNRTDIISSYNIGEFRKKLEPYGFFSTHKSHLINLKKIKRYHREGTITLMDDSAVPVARRRKVAFLEHMPKI